MRAPSLLPTQCQAHFARDSQPLSDPQQRNFSSSVLAQERKTFRLSPPSLSRWKNLNTILHAQINGKAEKKRKFIDLFFSLLNNETLFSSLARRMGDDFHNSASTPKKEETEPPGEEKSIFQGVVRSSSSPSDAKRFAFLSVQRISSG